MHRKQEGCFVADEFGRTAKSTHHGSAHFNFAAKLFFPLSAAYLVSERAEGHSKFLHISSSCFQADKRQAFISDGMTLPNVHFHLLLNQKLKTATVPLFFLAHICSSYFDGVRIHGVICYIVCKSLWGRTVVWGKINYIWICLMTLLTLF